jgi:hypothetical protein
MIPVAQFVLTLHSQSCTTGALASASESAPCSFELIGTQRAITDSSLTLGPWTSEAPGPT